MKKLKDAHITYSQNCQIFRKSEDYRTTPKLTGCNQWKPQSFCLTTDKSCFQGLYKLTAMQVHACRKFRREVTHNTNVFFTFIFDGIQWEAHFYWFQLTNEANFAITTKAYRQPVLGNLHVHVYHMECRKVIT